MLVLAGVIARTNGDAGVGAAPCAFTPVLWRGAPSDRRITGVALAMKAGLAIASAKASADEKRSEGRLAIAVRIAASTWGGMAGLISDGAGGCAVMTCAAIACGVDPLNAASPVSIS